MTNYNMFSLDEMRYRIKDYSCTFLCNIHLGTCAKILLGSKPIKDITEMIGSEAYSKIMDILYNLWRNYSKIDKCYVKNCTHCVNDALENPRDYPITDRLFFDTHN